MKKPSSTAFYSADLDLEMHDFRCMTLVNDQTGFIGGSFDSVWQQPDDTLGNGFPNVKSQALIFKTGNAGHNWKKIPLGQGAVSSILYGRRVTDDKEAVLAIRTRDTTSDIVVSYDLGGHWDLLLSLNGIVRDAVIVEGVVFMNFAENGGESWLLSSSDWRRWDRVKMPFSISSSLVILKDCLIGVENDGTNSEVRSYCKHVNVINRQLLPSGFLGNTLAPCEAGFKIAGVQKGCLYLYKLDVNLKVIKASRYCDIPGLYPQRLFANGDADWIVCGTSGDVEKTVLIHRNGMWERIRLTPMTRIETVAFLNENTSSMLWLYQGLGHFQVIKEESK